MPLRVAVMTAVWPEVTAAAVAVKLKVVVPDGSVNEEGTVTAAVLLLDRETTEPPAGAGLARVTVQLVALEAVKVVMMHCRELRVAGEADETTVRVIILLEPLRVAVMMGVWSEVTAAAVAIKVVEVAPAATVTAPGTVAAAVLLLERATVEPPEGAALERVTVQVVVEEAVRVMLAHCREAGAAAESNDRLEVASTPFRVALAVAV